MDFLLVVPSGVLVRFMFGGLGVLVIMVLWKGINGGHHDYAQ